MVKQVHKSEDVPIEKQEFRRIWDEIRQALLTYWDPIRVKDEPMAQDEYDMYIDPLFTLLWRNATHEEVSAYLWEIIEERIGLHPEHGATEETVKRLKQIRLRQES